MSVRPRAVFFGTPSFAVPCLAALTEVAEVVAAVCQPDKPAGRGNVLTAPPVKRWAEEHGIPVHQPVKLRDGAFATWLRGLAPDLAVVVAYGRILPVDVLTAPRLGCVNVHASVLPKHRGAAPINWAILRGDDETGVTLMQMDEGLDTGPMLALRRTPIGLDDTAPELSLRLQALGAELIRDELPRLVSGALHPVAQNGAEATHAPLLTKEMAKIDWRRGAREVHDQVRGLQPWPGASTTLGARRLIVCATRLDQAPATLGGAPGEVVAVRDGRIWVATGAGLVALTEVQLEGKKRMPTREFLVGHPMRTGTLLGTE
ncbi:MAG: methionyl-tRNA formyltransferase [Polyangiales bacterium]